MWSGAIEIGRWLSDPTPLGVHRGQIKLKLEFYQVPVKFGVKLIGKLRWIKIWHLVLPKVVRHCINWKVTLRSDPFDPGSNKKSNSNFFRNQSNLVSNSSEIALNKEMVFTLALCGQVLWKFQCHPPTHWTINKQIIVQCSDLTPTPRIPRVKFQFLRPAMFGNKLIRE